MNVRTGTVAHGQVSWSWERELFVQENNKKEHPSNAACQTTHGITFGQIHAAL
jgi:hypothetical protein